MKKAYNLKGSKEIEVSDFCYTDKIHEDSVCPYCNNPIDKFEARLSNYLFIKGNSIPICLKCWYYVENKGRWSEEKTAYRYNHEKEHITKWKKEIAERKKKNESKN